MVLVAAVLAAGTIFEKIDPTVHIYNQWWFVALLALVAVAAIVSIAQGRMWKRIPLLLVHASIPVILLGGALTTWTSQRGDILLLPGQVNRTVTTEVNQSWDLPFDITLNNFELVNYTGTRTPMDFVSHVTVEGKDYDISMNHILRHHGYRFYQSDYDEDLRGSLLAMNSDPWGIPVTYCGYALLFVSLVWMLADPQGKFRQQLSILRKQRFPLAMLTAFLMACFVLLLYHFLGKYSAANHPLPVLNSRLLPLHVSTIMMAYTLLLLTFIISLVGIAVSKQRQKMYHLSQVMLFPALLLLCYGIFIGAIWANVSWGNYWSWDPKETWALITLMIYAAPAHRSFSNMSPRKYHLYMTVAFFTILMTYLGVNYFLGGMHSYA